MNQLKLNLSPTPPLEPSLRQTTSDSRPCAPKGGRRRYEPDKALWALWHEDPRAWAATLNEGKPVGRLVALGVHPELPHVAGLVGWWNAQERARCEALWGVA